MRVGSGGRRSLRAALALLGCGLTPAIASAAPPNVVVIVTDDQALGSLRSEVMPQTVRKLAHRGTSFRQAVVATPQCCPSRAGLLSGQYPQNNGLTSNRPGYSMLERKGQVLPAWLRRAGYRTVHVGKFLNGYGQVRGREPAPGWDRWLTLVAPRYQRPGFSIDGRPRSPKRYLGATLNRMAVRMVRRYVPRRRPLYLQLDHFAPHVGADEDVHERCAGAAIPAPVDRDRFRSARAPRSAAFDEADVADKPAFLRRRPRFDRDQLSEIDRHFGCALAALRSVDRGVRRVVKALRRSGELSRTMIVFTSDNGYPWGEHRIAMRKGLPYEEHVRVPLLIRPPHGFPRASRRGRSVAAPVANIDLAPTILSIAGASPCRAPRSCRRLDGRSLRPILRGKRPDWTSRRAIRTAFFIHQPSFGLSCRWDAYRTPAETVIHHVSVGDSFNRCRPADVWESYDLRTDPAQLEAVDSATGAAAARLDRLRRCSGIRGRNRPSEGIPFCE